MAFANLDSIHQYNPPAFKGRHIKRPSAVRNRGAPTVSNTHKNPMAGALNISRSARLDDFDLIEYSNLASSLLIDYLDRSRILALECGPIESHAYSNIYYY